MMKRLAQTVSGIAALGLLILASTTPAFCEPATMSPIHQFIDNFNKGDEQSAAEAFALVDLAIIDEFPPFKWVGRNAFQAWIKDLTADSERNETTNQAVFVGQPSYEVVYADRAYLVAPAIYTYKQRGRSIRQSAEMAFSLTNNGHGWLITGFTFVGMPPKATGSGR